MCVDLQCDLEVTCVEIGKTEGSDLDKPWFLSQLWAFVISINLNQLLGSGHTFLSEVNEIIFVKCLEEVLSTEKMLN